MSSISDIQDAIIAAIKVVLPTYAHIPNPYEIENNPGRLLDKGFAVAIGESSNQRRMIKQQLFELRTFEVFLIRRATHTENNVASRVSLEQVIMEDAFLLKKEFENETTLGGLCVQIEWESDSGLAYIVPEGTDNSRDKYYALNMVFSVEYREDLGA